MARTEKRLVASQVKSLGAGRHADGGGLYLVKDGVSRSRWIFMWTIDGKRREMGLGHAGTNGISLSDARDAAARARLAIRRGEDPIIDRDTKAEAPREIPTFGAMADQLIAAKASGWRSSKTEIQWRMTMKVYAGPLRMKRVDEVTTDDVLAVLNPIWLTKPETASRTRNRIESILDSAKAQGLRGGDNPARLKGHLDHLLPSRPLQWRSNHKALPYPEVPDFIRQIRAQKSGAALALEFLILTAARTSEVLRATWGEIDLDGKVWTIPALRMKDSRRDHRVPLGDRAIEILNQIKLLAGGKPPANHDFIFPGRLPGKPLSQQAMLEVPKRMKLGITVHGFRSSFRDWAGEETEFPRELSEAALAHKVGDDTELAYRRGDALERRRKLMAAWEGFCAR